MIKAYFIWFGILVASILIFLRKENVKPDSRTITMQIKGVAIMLVIFGHLSRTAGVNNSFINLLGAQGVVLFLIISGYGLFKAYNRKGIGISYWKKRISTVLIPYSVVTAIFICIDMVFLDKQYSLSYILKNIIGFNSENRFDGTMWYIQFIAIWYIIFGLGFYFKKLKDFRLVLLFIVAAMFYMQLDRKPFSMYYYQCAVHAFWFPLGVLIGRYSDSLKKFIEHRLRLVAGIVVSFVFVAFMYDKIGYNNNIYIMYNFVVSFIFVSIIFIGASFHIHSRMLDFIGNISYQLYLFEGLFIYNYNIIRQDRPFISFMYYFGVIFFLSISFKRAMKYFWFICLKVNNAVKTMKIRKKIIFDGSSFINNNS
jgi:peptidoglycan/LPS O-acetylase OafA/YrhL